MFTIPSHGVGSLLIGQKKNQVRFTHRVESSAYVRNEKEERQTSFGPLPRNTAWETDYAQRLEAKCWQPVEKLALTAAYACVSPTGSLSSGFCIVQPQSRSFSRWEKARMRGFQHLCQRMGLLVGEQMSMLPAGSRNRRPGCERRAAGSG